MRNVFNTFVEYTMNASTSIHEMNRMLKEAFSKGHNVRMNGVDVVKWFAEHNITIDEDFLNKFDMVAHLAESHGHCGVTNVAEEVSEDMANAIYDTFTHNNDIVNFCHEMKTKHGFKMLADSSYNMVDKNGVVVIPDDIYNNGEFGYITIDYSPAHDTSLRVVEKVMCPCDTNVVLELAAGTEDAMNDYIEHNGDNSISTENVLNDIMEAIEDGINEKSLADLGFMYDADILPTFVHMYYNRDMRMHLALHEDNEDCFMLFSDLNYSTWMNDGICDNMPKKADSKGNTASVEPSPANVEEHQQTAAEPTKNSTEDIPADEHMPTKEEVDFIRDSLDKLHGYMKEHGLTFLFEKFDCTCLVGKNLTTSVFNNCGAEYSNADSLPAVDLNLADYDDMHYIGVVEDK